MSDRSRDATQRTTAGGCKSGVQRVHTREAHDAPEDITNPGALQLSRTHSVISTPQAGAGELGIGREIQQPLDAALSSALMHMVGLTSVLKLTPAGAAPSLGAAMLPAGASSTA
jgi:hypothetical protein